MSALLERAATLADLGRMSEMLADARHPHPDPAEHPNGLIISRRARRARRKLSWPLALPRTGGALDDQPAACCSPARSSSDRQ
jgi:hypothetical protein